MTVKITGVIAKVYPVNSFQYNGATYNFQDVIINTPDFQRTVPVCVKFNTGKMNMTEVIQGHNVEIDCNIKSTCKKMNDGREFWNTTLTAWKLKDLDKQQGQQPVQQQNVEQENDNLPF